MIRFACPTCKKVLQAPPAQCGQKVACPGCNQRLQIPAPPRNKTVLASFLPENEPQAQQAATPVAAGALPAAHDNQLAEAPASVDWFYVHNGERNGPVSFAELQRLAATDLDPQALVWTTTMADWVAASTVPGLSFSRSARGGESKALAWAVSLAALAAGVVAIFFGIRDLAPLFAEVSTPSEITGPESPKDKNKTKNKTAGGKNNKEESRHKTESKPKPEPKPEPRPEPRPKPEQPRQEPPQAVALKKRNLVASRLAIVGKEYATNLEKSAKVLDEALKREEDPSQALIKFRTQIAPSLQSQAAAMNELTAALNGLSADPNLPRQSLPAVTELFNKCVEMRDLLEGKGLDRYTPKTYAEKVDSLNREYAELITKL